MDKPPKGWSEHDPCSSEPNRPVKCDSCYWEGFEADHEFDLWGIADICERLCPGGVTPVGECPAKIDDPNVGLRTCRSLVYYSDIEIVYRRKPGILDKIVEAIE